MSRATVVYIIMLLACAAGVWLILRAGNRLKPPPDLNGTWEISRIQKLGSDEPPALGNEMTIEQSGRFVHIRFASGLKLDLKASVRDSSEANGSVTIDLSNGQWNLRVRPDASELALLIDRPTRAAFTARPRENDKRSLTPNPSRSAARHAS